MSRPAWWEVFRPPSGNAPVEPDLGKEAGAVVWISSVPRFPHLQSGLGVPVACVTHAHSCLVTHVGGGPV